jgi:hypothetical protein
MFLYQKSSIRFAILCVLSAFGFGSAESRGDYAASLFIPLDSIQIKSPVKSPIGPCYAVAHDRMKNIVFCGAGDRILLFDVTEPLKPVLRPETIVAAGPVYDLFYDAHVLYAACGEAGLDIWDIGDLSQPRRLATGSIPGWSYALTVAGSYAFIAAGDSGLQIVDVADPKNPILTGHFITPGVAVDVAINGYYAFVAAYDAGLRIINIAQPDHPHAVGFFELPQPVFAVHAGSRYAYLAGVGGLHVVSVKNLFQPFEVSFYRTPSAGRDLAVVYPYAYIADYTAGIRIINIARPDNPSEAGYYDTPGLAFRLLVDEGCAFIADGNGFIAQNVSRPANRATLIIFPILFVLMWFPIIKLFF